MIVKKFGSVDAFGEALDPLAVRILGHYQSEFFGAARKFHYTLEMPGPIVETSGVLLTDRKARWTFSAGDAYPFGFSMHSRALVAQPQLESELLGKPVLTDRARMLQYVELLRSDDALLTALRSCAARSSMKPLYEQRARLDEDSSSRPKFDAMLKLLELPATPPGK